MGIEDLAGWIGADKDLGGQWVGRRVQPYVDTELGRPSTSVGEVVDESGPKVQVAWEPRGLANKSGTRWEWKYDVDRID